MFSPRCLLLNCAFVSTEFWSLRWRLSTEFCFPRCVPPHGVFSYSALLYTEFCCPLRVVLHGAVLSTALYYPRRCTLHGAVLSTALFSPRRLVFNDALLLSTVFCFLRWVPLHCVCFPRWMVFHDAFLSTIPWFNFKLPILIDTSSQQMYTHSQFRFYIALKH